MHNVHMHMHMHLHMHLQFSGSLHGEHFIQLLVKLVSSFLMDIAMSW